MEAELVTLEEAELVTLEVGGVRFEVSLSALQSVPGSMLAIMFGRRADLLQRSPDGTVVIHRDGDRFQAILAFLQDLDAERAAIDISALPCAGQQAMMGDLDYFGLTDAVFPPPPWHERVTWVAGPEMPSERGDGAVVLAGPRVVVFGGLSGPRGNDDSQWLKTTSVFDSGTMTWAAGPAMCARTGSAAVIIDADRALLVGGAIGFLLHKSTEILDLRTLTFAAGPEMLEQRTYFGLVALDARRVLVAGGLGGQAFLFGDVSHLTSTEILDISSMTFSAGPRLLTARMGCAAVALDDRRVMVIGGFSDGEHLTTTEVLDLATMSWTPGPEMRTARVYHGAVSLDERRVLVMGGEEGHEHLSSTEVLDLELMQFEKGPMMGTARSGFVAVADAEQILVFGGENESGSLATTEVLAVDDGPARRLR